MSADEPVVFRVSRRRRAMSILTALLAKPALLAGALVAFALAGRSFLGPGVDGESESMAPYVWLLLAIAAALLAVLVWRSVRDECRFTLRIGPEELVFGSGPFRATMACQDVETVYYDCSPESLGKIIHPHLELFGAGQRWLLPFGEDGAACCLAICDACPHAVVRGPILIERTGLEAPRAPRRMRNRARAVRREAWACLWIIIPSAGAIAAFAVTMEDRPTWLTCLFLFILAFAALSALRAMLRGLRLSRVLSDGVEVRESPDE